MENEFVLPEEDLFEREEKCQKAIRTVTKALIMRLVVVGLMVWVVITNPRDGWAWGLMAFVALITVVGAVPLWQERTRQKKLLRNLIEQEEN